MKILEILISFLGTILEKQSEFLNSLIKGVF